MFISVGSAFLFDIVVVDVVELGGVVFFFRRGGLCWMDNDLDISACWSLVCKEWSGLMCVNEVGEDEGVGRWSVLWWIL